MIKCSDKVCKCILSLNKDNNYINRFIYKKCFENKEKYNLINISRYINNQKISDKLKSKTT